LREARKTVAISGVGFGPINPSVAGIIEAGLFQIVVPNVPAGDQAITASVGGAAITGNIFLTVQ